MAVPEGYSPLGRLGYVDRGTYAASTKYMKGDVVYYNGSTYTALKDNLTGVTPVNGSNWKYMARGFSADNLSNVQAKDTSGVIGTAGATVVSQDLIDAIADKVMTKLLAKTDIVQTESTATNKVPSSAYIKQMFDTANSNLALKANAADYALINLSGANFVYSESSSTVGIQWMFGANKEYGYAINISTVNGTMRFYYLSNGAWLEAWVK